jgi:hypothetical protein
MPAKLERLEERLDKRMEKIEGRISNLETSDTTSKATKNVWVAILQSPALGWFVGAVGTLIAVIVFIFKVWSKQ